MPSFIQVLSVCAAVACASGAPAATVSFQNGGDSFRAGGQVSDVVDTAGDAFVAGRSVQVSGATQGDLHIAGFDVSVGMNVAEDLYAAGASVFIRGTIGKDLTAAGFSLRTENTSKTEGNARLIGNTVTIDGPIAGALSVTGRDVILNAAISGDMRVLAQTLSFGPDATVAGTLTYSTEERLSIPERVASADRVVFEKITRDQMWQEWDDFGKEMPGLPALEVVMSGFVISLLFFLVLGALMLGFMPKRLARLRKSIAAAPGKILLLGVVGLSILFGMVPITALTIVGLPFVPVVLLAIVVVWTLGYALGAYSVAMRVWVGLGGAEEAGNVTRLLVFAGAIIFIALLNFIPFVGWVTNYTLVLLGIGAMTQAVFQYTIGNPGAALDVDLEPIDK